MEGLELPLRGSCLCGRVRFEVDEDFASVSACHCTNCKKISGGAGTVSGRAASNTVRVVAGAEHLAAFQPSEGTSKTFCSACGSNLFGGGWPDAEVVSVRLSALDVPYARKPEWRVYVRSAAPWETLPEDGAQRWDPAE